MVRCSWCAKLHIGRMGQQKTDRVGVRIEPKLRRRLVRAAGEDGRPVGNLIRRICAEWLAQQEAAEAARGDEVEKPGQINVGYRGSP